MELKHPFGCICAGPTQSGKTYFVKKFVANLHHLVSPVPTYIYWCYSEWQPAYNDLQGHVTLISGLPDMSMLQSNANQPQLLILDDMMQEMKTDPRLVQLFTRGSHHWNLSCLHIVQNLFFQGLRTSRVNAQYLVLMKWPSDRLQITNLGKQLFPGKLKYFLEAYDDATQRPYGYLLVDLNQATSDKHRLRSNIFPGETMYVYVPK